VSRGQQSTAISPRRGSRAQSRPGSGSPAARAGSLFYSEHEAADDLDMSETGLGLARSRGECTGMYMYVGRRVLWSRAAVRLRALGLDSPEALGRFVKAAGIKDLDGLIRWLGSTQEASH
jgi:hypothetical protein